MCDSGVPTTRNSCFIVEVAKFFCRVQELELVEKWARDNCVRFPPINCLEQFKENGWKECYVFQDPADPECPIVLHFILNNISYRDYVEPGGYFTHPSTVFTQNSRYTRGSL